MSKILLVNPPIYKHELFARGAAAAASMLPPLGLAYIAACLQRAGHVCEIVDGMVAPVSLDKICEKARSFDVIGITIVTPFYLRAKEMIDALRRNNPGQPIMVGGPHVTADYEEVLRDGADYAVIGEGEYTTVELVDWLGRKDSAQLSEIQGIAFLDEDNALVKTAKRPLIADLDDLPMPARELLPMHLYNNTPSRATAFPSHSIMVSRGCPGVCTFCNQQTFGHKVRTFSPQRIVEEIELLINQYGANDIAIWDDNFTANKAVAMEVCQRLIDSGFNKSFSVESRADNVDEELLRKLREAGCEYIAYGIESGSQRILDYVHKRETLEQLERVVEKSKKAGLKVRGYFILGLPSETADEIRQTIAFAKRIGLDTASFTLMVPFPGSVDYKRAQKSGTFNPKYYRKSIVEDCNFPKRVIYTPEGMTPDELISLHKKAYNEFYLRPWFILKNVLQIRSVDELMVLVKGGYTLIKNALTSVRQ